MIYAVLISLLPHPARMSQLVGVNVTYDSGYRDTYLRYQSKAIVWYRMRLRDLEENATLYSRPLHIVK